MNREEKASAISELGEGIGQATNAFVISFKGAMLNGQIVPADQIQAIANLPSREELVSKLLFLMQSPIRGLVTVLQANIRNLAVVIGQIAEQRGAAGTTDSEAAPAAETEANA